MRPDFLIIGAEKAGTTWLYDVLRSHPDVFLPDTKELHFFNRLDSNGRGLSNYETKGPAWYERQFADARPDQLLGEATPLYLCDPAAPGRIQQALPKTRFIVLLRNPVSRTWSHFRMARAKGHLADDLDCAIRRRDPNILGRGLYAQQLDLWMSLFPRDRFLIRFFEDLAVDPQLVLSDVSAWLGISSVPLLSADPQKPRNPATGYRSAALHNASVRGARALRSFPPTRGLAKRMKAAGLYDVVKSANRKAAIGDHLTARQQADLTAFFKSDVARLVSDHGLMPPWPEFGAPLEEWFARVEMAHGV